MKLIEEFSTDITIHAPAQRVWEALTSAPLVHEYLNVEVISTWEKGTPLVYRHPWEGEIYEDKGYILDIIPEKLIQFSYLPAAGALADEPDNYQIVTCELTALSGITTVKITQTNIKDDFFGTRAPELWGETLRGLKATAEAQH